MDERHIVIGSGRIDVILPKKFICLQRILVLLQRDRSFLILIEYQNDSRYLAPRQAEREVFKS